MTLTLATRWRITVRVQSLARVTYPAPVAAVAPPPAKKPDLLAIAEANRMHDDMVALRHQWQERAMLSFPRIF